MEKDFLKLPLAIQMAIVSFSIGTFILLLHFVLKNSDLVIIIGIYYLVIAFIVNGLMLLKLIFDWVTESKNRKSTLLQITILLINIPIAFFYFYLVITSI